MRILILGSGGREHALYRKIKQSPRATKVTVWPGNGLIPRQDRVILPAISNDFAALADYIFAERIDCTVVGNETPLVAGVRNFLKEKFPNHYVFGPDQLGAQLEGSKAFSDSFMREAKIPHGESVVVGSLEQALKALPAQPLPVVIKADGLAAGKGVSIHHDYASAEVKLRQIFTEKIFGDAGNCVLLQRYLQGSEASLFAILNGEDAILLPVARDYKRALDADKGDNTGGMGAYCPGEHINDRQKQFVREKIIEPVLKKFRYRGLLYVGLMVGSASDDDVAVVEFNCRFGDPETQSILHLLEGDLLEYLLWADGYQIEFPLLLMGKTKLIPWRRGAVVNVVIAARGYPNAFEKAIPLHFPQYPHNELHITGAGIEELDGRLYSTSGRIANVVAYAENREKARLMAYDYLQRFAAANSAVIDKLYWRQDIAAGI